MNGYGAFGPLSIIGLTFVRRLGGQCCVCEVRKWYGCLKGPWHPFPYKGRTVAICFWEMVERLTHTRMGGGVWSPRGPHVGGAGGLWSEEVTCMGEGGLAWRPHSGSRRPDMRTTRPDGRGRPRPPPIHAQTIERVTLSRHADHPACRVDTAHPHTSHRTDHPAPTCGSPCMMGVGAPRPE